MVPYLTAKCWFLIQTPVWMLEACSPQCFVTLPAAFSTICTKQGTWITNAQIFLRLLHLKRFLGTNLLMAHPKVLRTIWGKSGLLSWTWNWLFGMVNIQAWPWSLDSPNYHVCYGNSSLAGQKNHICLWISTFQLVDSSALHTWLSGWIVKACQVCWVWEHCIACFSGSLAMLNSHTERFV